jgi:hypothetical protein
MRTAALLLSLLAVDPAVRARAGEEPGRGKKTPAQMVDALANRNKLPKLVKVYVDRLPLFPRDYDWEEEHRVLAALTDISKDTSEGLWEELVRRSDDPRYCLTDMDGGDWAWNRTVGDVCARLAFLRLAGPVVRHRPPESRSGRVPGLTAGFVYPMTLDVKPGLREWRRTRKDKALYQLQLELCEQALAKLREDRNVPEDLKEAPRKGIEAEAAKLRKTKRPVLEELGGEIFDTCVRAYAERCRKTIEGKE